MTDKMVELCDTNHQQAAHVLAEADSSIAQMKKAFAALELATSTNEVCWDEVRLKVDKHLSGDCSVCLMPLLSEFDTTDGTERGVRAPSMSRGRPLSLLSCGHVLHQTCIEALERFSHEPLAVGTGDCTSVPYLCPLCRTLYSRTSLWNSVPP